MPKISALPAMTTAEAADEQPIVDKSAGSTKKWTLTLVKTYLQSLLAWITPSMLNLAPAKAIVATSQTTTSTTFADLATAGPSVTVTVGSNGLLLIGISANVLNNTNAAFSFMSFVLSGANTLASADINSFKMQQPSANLEDRKGITVLLTGLTPGSTTVKAQYRVQTGGAGAGTSTWADRQLWALPL